MTPFECYCEYLALKKHFTSTSYDYFKYNGKVKASVDSFNNRNDKYFFEKLAKHKDPKGFLVANLIVNPNGWIKDLAFSEDAAEIYSNWQWKMQSINYRFHNELSRIPPNFNEILEVKNGQHPELLKQYLSEEIYMETLCIILAVSGCKKYWDKQLSHDPIWKVTSILVSKYTPFIKYDEEKIKESCLEHFR